MKIIRTFVIVSAALIPACLLNSCTQNEETDPVVSPYVSVATTSVEIPKEGGSQTIKFTTNKPWTATSDADWLTITPPSGQASESEQQIKVTAGKNEGASRTATVGIAIEDRSANATVVQASSDDRKTMTIADFIKTSTSDGEWYRLNAEIASIANYQYGNFYVVDETGYLYVYGLTKEKSDVNKGAGDFSALGLKVGDKLTFMARHSKYNDKHEAGGTVPAYYESHTPGNFIGTRSSSTKASWMELPETRDDDGFDVLTQFMYESSKLKGNRSYTTYWDGGKRLARWQAYYLCKDAIGSGSRSESYSYHPLLNPEEHANIGKSSYKVGNGRSYVRGHMVPNADRYSYRENIEVFFSTNIMPQNSDLNTGTWSTLEDSCRKWYKNCDTLYIVVGTYSEGSTEYVLDNDGTHITVPAGIYRAILRYSKTEGYSAAGFYFDNISEAKSIPLKDASMSIADLEKKVGENFFVNLPTAIGEGKASEVENQDPKTVSYWW